MTTTPLTTANSDRRHPKGKGFGLDGVCFLLGLARLLSTDPMNAQRIVETPRRGRVLLCPVRSRRRQKANPLPHQPGDEAGRESQCH